MHQIKMILDVLNAQLKAFCPSKYLLILNAGAHFYLISERNQVGRDSGGRTFSARHFARGGKTELEEKNSLLRIVNSFLDPVDYALPEENTFLPAAQPGRFSEEVYFDLIWDACMRGRKICIVNEEVDQYSHTSKENLATLVFANFPGAQGLLNAMNLLPPAIQKKISACFNYENNFIASGKLSQVNIIFCGNKTLIEDGIEDVHEINFELLKSSGFDVLKIAQFENDEKKWAVVFRFLNNQDAVADLFYAGIYHKWCAQNTQASLVKMVQYCSFLANMSSSIEQYQPAFESVQELLSITGLTIDEKLQLYEKAISSLSTDALAADFYLYAGLAESAELESAFTMLLQKYFDASQLRPEQKMLLFTHPDFEKLHPAQKIFLYESFWNTSYKRDFFSQPATLKIIKSLPQSIKPAGLDNVWEEYLPPAPILLTDIDALEVLFNKTQKEQEYALVLSKAFDHMADAAWLAAAVKANIKLDIDFPESISGIDEAKRYVEIISDHGKALLVEWLLQFEKKVASILDYTDDLTGLLFFEKAVRKHHVFQLISKYKEVIAAINKRIAGLLVAKLTDEPETFHHQLAEASPDGDALKKEIEKSVQPNCYAIIDFGFLINYTRLLKKSSFSHGEIIHRINSFLAYYKEISPALQGNKNKIDKALLKELKKIKGYETLPGALLNHLDSFWGKVKKKINK